MSRQTRWTSTNSFSYDVSVTIVHHICKFAWLCCIIQDHKCCSELFKITNVVSMLFCITSLYLQVPCLEINLHSLHIFLQLPYACSYDWNRVVLRVYQAAPAAQLQQQQRQTVENITRSRPRLNSLNVLRQQPEQSRLNNSCYRRSR